MTSQCCDQCGNNLEPNVNFCTKCGAKIQSISEVSNSKEPQQFTETKSEKSAITALLLCIFLGAFGAHRFYVRKIGTGILMLLTAGGLGIWTLVDLILIASCEFKDKENKYLIFTRGKKSPVKLILTIVGSVIAVIIVYFILLITLVLSITGGLTETVQNQLAALKSGDFEKAYYSYTSKEFQTNTSFDDFKKFINLYPTLKNNKSASFTSREVKNGEGKLKGTLQSKDGEKTQIEYYLIKEGDVWKIIGIKLSAQEGGVEINTHSDHSSPNEKTLLNTYEDSHNKFSIKYPGNWEYQQQRKNTVIFSGKKGTRSYYSTISIEIVPTKKGGGIYKNTGEAIDSVKKQILEQASDVKIMDGGEVELPQNPKKFHGKVFIATYIYKGNAIKKMQFIISQDNGSVLYSWGFTSPMEQYANDLPIAKAMYESWVIE